MALFYVQGKRPQGQGSVRYAHEFGNRVHQRLSVKGESSTALLP